MKFTETQNKLDTNYDDLENSIADSLSEISIASNMPLNKHNQELINKTVSQVIAAYLWSTDLNILGGIGHEDDLTNKRPRKARVSLDLEQPVRNAWDDDSPVKSSYDNKQEKATKKSSTIQTIYDENTTLDDSVNKNSPKKGGKTSNRNSISTGSTTTSYFLKDDAKAAKQGQQVVPPLDFRSLEDKNYKSPETNKHPSNKTDVSKSNFYDTKTKNYDSHFKKPDLENTSSIKIEIEVLLKDLKLIITPQTAENNEFYDEDNETKLSKAEADKLNQMAFNLRDLLTRLFEKRKIAKRMPDVDKMTKEEVQAEKIDTQKELLSFEEKHGRPQTKLEKDLMRPLYDHYRKVKRILGKSTTGGKNQLATNETHDEEHMDDDDTSHLREQKHFMSLHSLSYNELIKEKENAHLDKNKLKDQIKKCEADFQKAAGRALTKEDREYHKEDFERYKLLKAKIKLIDTILEKYETNKR